MPPPLSPAHRAIADLTAHCDLSERRNAVPPNARIRGLYLRNVETVLSLSGRLEAFREIFPETYSSLRWYPVIDYMTRLAVAGALLTSPREVHDGMYEIGRRNAVAFSDSLLGRTMLRFLAREPESLLRQAVAGRRLSCQYGRWELQFSDRRATMSMFEEYLWIESHIAGAAVGTFETIGVGVQVTTELDSPFQGRTILRW